MIRNRYEVVRLLGEGSLGRTLLCVDSQTGERVAVKELHFARLDDWKHLELFEREADVLSRLDHPGIPKVLDSFREGDESTLYIVQEFVDGTSLQRRIDAGPMLGLVEVRNIARGLLDVLEYLHGRVPPVLHRDIKPSNVLVRVGGEVALVDFGGAWFGWRQLDQPGATVVGTFGYMPPEQLVGQAAPASDLYGLGATLLHCVTGKSPTEFSFDSGRIEVPPNLIADARLARLIEVLLRPAPRDRPRSAAAARDILNDEAGSPSVSVVVPDRRRRSPDLRAQSALRRGYGPRFVDLGRPPRDPEGEFRDVYSNLMNPLFPARRTWSRGVHAIWIVQSGMLGIVTLGIAPIVYAVSVRHRQRMYEDLFRSGRFTHGLIVSVDKGPVYATFRFEFEVDGEVYVGSIEYAQEMARFWGQGEIVPVLYDPDDPNHSCFVYR